MSKDYRQPQRKIGHEFGRKGEPRNRSDWKIARSANKRVPYEKTLTLISTLAALVTLGGLPTAKAATPTRWPDPRRSPAPACPAASLGNRAFVRRL